MLLTSPSVSHEGAKKEINMRVFVTGGSGFVGGTLIRRLVERGDTVNALARSDQARTRVVQLGAIPVMGDLSDIASLQNGMEHCDVVFHTAAALHFGLASHEQERANVQGTQAIIDATQRMGIPRLVAVSAASVIATGRPIIDADETRPFPPRFVGPYSRTKAIAERAILAANSPTLATMTIRPPGVWGVGDTNILPGIVRLVRQHQFVWFNHGQYAYSTCHVENLAEGLLAAAAAGRGGNTYFVTDGPPISFQDFVQGLLATQHLRVGERSIPWRLGLSVGKSIERIWGALRRTDPAPISYESAALIGPFSLIDLKARQELGYRGTFQRETGLGDLTRQHRQQS